MKAATAETSSVLDAALRGLIGTVDGEQTPAGFVPLRLTRRSLATVSDPAAAALARMPAGARFRVITDARWLEVLCQLTLIRSPAGLQPAVFEVTLRGSPLTTVSSLVGHVIGVADLSFEPGQASVVRVPLGKTGSIETYEIWLPPAAQIAIKDIRIPTGATLQAEADSRPSWIHHGSSISNCIDAPQPSATWPAVAAASLGYAGTNLGFSGQCLIDQFAARSIRDTACALITLELGINVVNADVMRERAFVSAVHGFLDTIRDGQAETPIVVISPIACPIVENHPGPTSVGVTGMAERDERPASLAVGALSLGRIRELLETIVALRRSHGDTNLFSLSGLDILGMGDISFLRDGLHPRPEAWSFMGQRTADLIRGLGLGQLPAGSARTPQSI